jgi:hypothetical protein
MILELGDQGHRFSERNNFISRGSFNFSVIILGREQ